MNVSSVVYKKAQALKDSFFAKVFPPAVLVFLTGLMYWPSLKYPFQFDDIANIAKRFSIRTENSFSVWASNTRWVGDWLNNLNYRLGGFDPFWYRAFNLVIHLSAGIVVFFLTYALCNLLEKKSFFVNNALYISFTTAGLFLLHPVQTQTVSYVIQARQEGLASLFVLMTLLAYIKTMTASHRTARLAYGSWFVLAALLSRGTKELVIVLPFLMLLVEWFFVAQEDWHVFKKRFAIGAAIAGVVLLAVLYQHSWSFLKDVLSFNATTVNNRGNILTPDPFTIITPWMYFISELRVLVHYLAIFFWPFGISVEYDWKIASGFFTPQVIVPAIILSALFGMVIRFLWRKEHVIVTFGLIWFYLVIAPRSTIIASPELVCDYKTYLASYGVLFMLGVWLVQAAHKIAENLKDRALWLVSSEAQMALLSLMLLTIGVGAHERNKVWSTAVAFWEDNARKAPGKARVHNNLGVALSEAGRYDESVPLYYKAISLDGYYADPYSNLAVAYSMQNKIDDAIQALRNAIHIFPEYPEAYNNLGTLLLQKGSKQEAEAALHAAVKLRPYYGKAHYNIARLHEERGELELSWESLKRAVEGDLDVAEVYFKYGQMSLKLKKYDYAANAFEWIINKGEGQDQVWFNLANSYYMMERKDEARGIYERLVKSNPLDPRYAYNLAEAHFARNEFEQACELFKRVATLPQPIPASFFRVANCYERMKQSDEAIKWLASLQALNADDDFKKMVKSEMNRVELQTAVTKGNGSVTLTQLKKALTNAVGDTKIGI
jgi:tetratricopeptide (TPR) repeat protein